MALATPAVVWPQDAAPAPVDAAKLGVSIDRIRRELAQATERQSTEGGPLRLEFVVSVYGQAPKIDLLKDFPIIGPVPFGAPTHREVLEVLTPQAYRTPAIPFSAMAMWAAQKLAEKSKKKRCEEEIEAYKRQVMAGIPVAAPQCTQE